MTDVLSRRQAIKLLGMGSIAGLAGCSSNDDGDDGGGNGGSGDGGDGAGGSLACTDLPGEFVAYDAGETPLICDVEIPRLAEQSTDFGPNRAGNAHRGLIRFTQDGEERLIKVGAILYAGEEVAKTATRVARGDRTRNPELTDFVGETQYDGETVQLYRSSQQEAETIGGVSADLPHEVDGYEIHMQLYFQVSEQRKSTVTTACGTALRDTALKFARSATPNPDTTFEEEVVSRWTDWPWDFLTES